MNEIIQSYKSYLVNDRGFTPETVKKYMSNIRIMFDKMNITAVNQLNDTIINKRLIDNFWEDLQKNKPVSDSTRASYLSALKLFLRFCYDINKLDKDIADKIKLPRARDVYLEGLSKKEQAVLRNYLATHLKTEKDLRDAALIMFLWGTATRVSEALNLNCHPDSYIYFHTESVRSGSFFMEDNKIYVHIMGKGKRDRKIRVNDDVLTYLNIYLHERGKRDEILFHNMHNQFNDKRRLSRNGASRIIERVFEACEIKRDKGVLTHTLRHTAINTWIEQGITSLQIIAMTGHSQASGLDLYFKRNKMITDIFGEDAKSTGNITDPRLKEMESLMRQRHAQIKRR